MTLTDELLNSKRINYSLEALVLLTEFVSIQDCSVSCGQNKSFMLL